MYTALIEDQPEKRSRGKSVFTFPLVLLFILVGVASTRHLLNVNANNDLESMLAETTPTKQISMEVVECAGDDKTIVTTCRDFDGSTDQCNAANGCKWMETPCAFGETNIHCVPTVSKKCWVKLDEDDDKKEWPDYQPDGSCPTPHIHECNEWWCLNKCTKPDCKVVMTLDIGSGATKPSLWAMKSKKDSKGKNIGIPDIRRVSIDATKKDIDEGKKFKPICGMWIDVNQFQGDKSTFCTTDKVPKPLTRADGMPLTEGCFRNKQCVNELWSCRDMYADMEGKKKGELEIVAESASDEQYYNQWIKHFENQMTCFLNKKLISGGQKMGPIKKYIDEIFGGATAGLRNDPFVVQDIHHLKEVKTILGDVSGNEQVHIRMLSGEEEGYYEWLGFNWATLQKFTTEPGSTKAELEKGLKNIFTVGGASAQVAIPTSQPMSTLDNTYYFHIGDHKYWIYANSIMWGGSTRLTNMVKNYAKKFIPEFDFNIKFEEAVNLNTDNLMDNFFKDNNELLCGDICKEPECKNNRRLYHGLCVMGFHFPDLSQWLTYEFVGNNDYSNLVGVAECPKKQQNPTCTLGCLSEKVAGSGIIDLGSVKKKCDNPIYNEKKMLKKGGYWSRVKPTVTLPFYGRFWNEVSDTKEFGFSKAEDINWSAIWAAMWIHGRFQGFPSLAPDAMEGPANEKHENGQKNTHRRNLAGLKGEYILGPLTIPAHFGTPEDEQ